MAVTIVQKGNKVLREISKEIPIPDIKKPKIQQILKDMNYALDNEYDGVALAAPQIGLSLRIFIISSKAFDNDFLYKGSSNPIKKYAPNLVFINPVITKISKDRKLMEEGCLSVRPIYGKVRRATRATVEAYDENGKKFSMSGTGLIAEIFQHETDHLEGILFTDKAKDLREVPMEEEGENK